MARPTKVVIPAAGLGTRMLPATKCVPKEMVPLANRPLIEHVVREAAESGFREVILVIAKGKEVMARHFRPDPALVSVLRARGQDSAADMLAALDTIAEITEVYQREPRGLGHAILCARDAVGNEPFGVILPDDVFLGDPGGQPALRELADLFEREGGGGAVALEEVAPEDTSRYGIIDGQQDGDIWRIHDLVEKPAPGTAPSRMAVPGRYCLPGRVFEILESTPTGHGGEIQLTDALRVLAADGELVGKQLQATRLDAGTSLGWLLANIEIALDDEKLRGPLAEGLRDLLMRKGPG